MKLPINLRVNGVVHELAVEPHKTLLSVLRDELRLTGAKCGCGSGECGACTVIMDGKAVVSCLALAIESQGKNILTIEGLAKGDQLHPVQAAMVESGAIECGFCTPGTVMTATALLQENPDPTEDEIRKAISGHICACTGYHYTIEAIKMAAKSMREGK